MSRELNPGGARYAGLGLFTSFETQQPEPVRRPAGQPAKDLCPTDCSSRPRTRCPRRATSRDDIFEPGVPQDSDDLEADEGPTLRDARHRFVLSGIARLPLRIRGIHDLLLPEPRPFNITTGTDDNGDGHLKDRPSGTGRNAGRADATISGTCGCPVPSR